MTAGEAGAAARPLRPRGSGVPRPLPGEAPSRRGTSPLALASPPPPLGDGLPLCCCCCCCCAAKSAPRAALAPPSRSLAAAPETALGSRASPALAAQETGSAARERRADCGDGEDESDEEGKKRPFAAASESESAVFFAGTFSCVSSAGAVVSGFDFVGRAVGRGWVEKESKERGFFEASLPLCVASVDSPRVPRLFFLSLSLLRSLALFFTSIFRVLSTASI